MEASFGYWVKRRRKALDLTQEELARQVGCSPSAIFKIESGERRPSRQIAELLAARLEIPGDQQALFFKVARQERAADALPDPQVSDQPPSPQPVLPIPSKPLVGREFELAEIVRLIGAPKCRLLTLTGQGGVGKTHLAQAVAGLGHPFPVAFASLAAVAGREQAVSAIAFSLGIVLYAATDRAEQLIAYLRDRDLLLVLDNFEHLIGEEGCVDLIGKILRETMQVKVLVTSREALQLQAEWVFEVQGLPVPENIPLAAHELNSAETLFIQRAAQAQVGFAPTREEQAAIARICRLVEGLPLGIELAAAWVRTLSCKEIAEEIARSLDFLATSSRDLPERQRSMRATIDYSWKHLSGEERRGLREMSVFRGGFTRQAAEKITGVTLNTLSALVAKSLIRRASPGRYDMHELIHQYAFEQLQSDGQVLKDVQKRFVSYYAGLLDQSGPMLKGLERPTIVQELSADIANLRQAWYWASTMQLAGEINRSADTLFWLYESRSNCREGVPLFGQAVQALRAAQDGLEPQADPDNYLALGQSLSYMGYFLYRQGQHPQGREALSDSLRILEVFNERRSPALEMAVSNTTIFLGVVTCVMGDFTEGERLLHDGLAQKRRLNDRWGAAFCLRQIGLAAYHYQGDNDQAYEALHQSLLISQQLQDTWSMAASLSQLGVVAHARGEVRQAQEHLATALELSRSLEDRASIAFALDSLALVKKSQGLYEESKRLFEESLALWSEIGEKGSLTQTHTFLGNLLLTMGDTHRARSQFKAAIAIAHQAQTLPVLLEALTGEAEVEIATGSHETALLILTAVILHSASSASVKTRAERRRDEIGSKIAPHTRAAVQERASRLAMDTLVDEVLKVQDTHSVR